MAAFWLLRLHLQSQVTKATKNQAIRGSAIATFLRNGFAAPTILAAFFYLIFPAKLKIHCFLCCSMLLYNKELDCAFLQKSVNSLFTGCK